MARWALFLFSALSFVALNSALLQRRFKRQTGASSSSSDAASEIAATGSVGKSDLEALKVKIVKKFLLAVLFSAQNDEKRTNETKVRVTRF